MSQVDSARILQALNALKFRENQDVVANVLLRLLDPELYEQVASVVHTGNLSRQPDGSWMWKDEAFRSQTVFGPTQWKFGRGLVSEKLNVTASCGACRQGMAFFDLKALAEGWQHCAKIEHAPEDFAAQWKRQDKLDRQAATELEEQREQQQQAHERDRVRFVQEQS